MYVRGSPSGSVEPEPSNWTVSGAAPNSGVGLGLGGRGVVPRPFGEPDPLHRAGDDVHIEEVAVGTDLEVHRNGAGDEPLDGVGGG